MVRKVVTSVLMTLILYVPAFAVGSNAKVQNKNTLPWEVIAETFDANEPFCLIESEDSNTINFALNSDVPVITVPSNVKKPVGQTEAELKLSVWQQGRFVDLSPLAVHVDSGVMTFDKNAVVKGFYSLSVVFHESDVGTDNEFHAIFAANWKKGLFAWCRKNKDQVESNRDPQLIRASIVVSHFDNLMELASESPVLSGKILSALSNAIKAKADFEGGNCPDLVIGMNKIRLKRFEGSAIAEFVIRIPESYDNSRKWPMHVYPNSPRGIMKKIISPDVIYLWWQFPMAFGYEWKDYIFLLNIISDKINLDRDKIYVCGDCGDGIASMDLALKHPDHWAECGASLGNASRHLAGNALNLPLIFVRGPHGEDRLVRYYDFAVECFKYHGGRFFKHNKHSKRLSIAQVRGNSVPTEVRDLSPCRVFYTIDSLANPSSYWVQIDGREDENFIASIDAIVWGQSILVKTKNVDAYTLNLELAPLDCNRPVEIIENDEHLGSVTDPVFVRTNPKYKNASYVKNKSLHGPVSDIFTDQYAVVWEGDESIKLFAEQIAGSGPCFSESNLPDGLVNTHNILFVGRLDKSEHFSQIADKLPVTIEDGRLAANGQVYEGDFGTLFVYPNPLNRQKYLAVLSGSTDKVLNVINSEWDQIKSKGDADVNIFKVSENNRIDWLISEKFNSVWDWHKSWDAPLVTLSKTYPKWKWRQCLGRILRVQLNADVMLLKDPFISAELPDAGEITLRDISKFFRNDWVVKIGLKGSDLKKVLSVSSNGGPSSQNSDLIIDGVSFIKQPGNSDVIWINELDSERHYTVAMPCKVIYDDRFKKVKNYRLEEQEFQVVLLRDYLKENTNLDLGAVLDGMRRSIY